MDALADDPNQLHLTAYNYTWNNPVNLTDPDGNCPNCISGLIGAGVGAIVGGGIEVASQIINDGTVSDWNAVGGSALQGAVTGGAAGFTGGASLLTTAAVGGTANIAGGALNRTVQGQETTVQDVAMDGTVGAVLGAGGKVVGDAVKKGVDKLSNAVKGKIGEKVTEVKFALKGYVSQGKAIVETGKKTATGRVQVAKYDHDMKGILSGKRLTVESKFNGSRLTPNQRAAADNVTTPGGLIIDRTTSTQIGEAAKATVVGSGGGAAAQMNKENH